MRAKPRTRIKLMCWMLALLVPAQPLLALDCPCACASKSQPKQGVEVTQRATSGRAAKCCGNCKGRCKERLAVANKQSAPRVRFFGIALRGCQCPAGCDCQWQHSSEIGLAAASQQDDFAVTLTVAPLCQSTFIIETSSIEAVAFSLPQTRHSACSSLSQCALFCRFVV